MRYPDTLIISHLVILYTRNLEPVWISWNSNNQALFHANLLPFLSLNLQCQNISPIQCRFFITLPQRNLSTPWNTTLSLLPHTYHALLFPSYCIATIKSPNPVTQHILIHHLQTTQLPLTRKSPSCLLDESSTPLSFLEALLNHFAFS